MLVINEDNLELLKSITPVRDVIRNFSGIKLDLSQDQVQVLIDDGTPMFKILRTWSRCPLKFVTDLGIEGLTYNELEAVALNPAISKLALDNHRFEQALPPAIFDEAMSNLTYEQCKEYRLDIIDVLKVATISPKDKVKLINDAVQDGLLPITNSKDLEQLSVPAITLLLADNLMDIKYKELLVSIDLINKDTVKNTRLYNGLLMLLAAGAYSISAITRLLIACNNCIKFDYIRNLPKIPNDVKTKEWFKRCEDNAATIKYIAACGKFNKTTLNEFIEIIESIGCMADMILLYENKRLTLDQKYLVRSISTPTIKVADYRPSLFDTFITEGSHSDIENFAITYRQYPTAMRTLQSPQALALTGVYYMYHLQDDVNFLLEYMLITHTVKLDKRTINKLISVIIKSGCSDAAVLFILSDNIDLEYKKQLLDHF